MTTPNRFENLAPGISQASSRLSEFGATTASTSILINTLSDDTGTLESRITDASIATLGLAAVFGGPLGVAVAGLGAGVFTLANQFGLLNTQVDENEVLLQSYRAELIRTGLDAVTAGERINFLRDRGRETGLSTRAAIDIDRLRIPRDRLFGDTTEQEIENLTGLLVQLGVDGVEASNAIRNALEGDFDDINRILFEQSDGTLGNIQSFEEVNRQIGQLYINIAGDNDDSLIGAFNKLQNREISFQEFHKIFVQTLETDTDENSELIQQHFAAIVAGLEGLDEKERDSLLLALQNSLERQTANGDLSTNAIETFALIRLALEEADNATETSVGTQVESFEKLKTQYFNTGSDARQFITDLQQALLDGDISTDEFATQAADYLRQFSSDTETEIQFAIDQINAWARQQDDLANRQPQPDQRYLGVWDDYAATVERTATRSEAASERIRQAAANAVAALSDLPTGTFGQSTFTPQPGLAGSLGDFTPTPPVTTPSGILPDETPIIQNRITLTLDSTPVVTDFITENAGNGIRQNRQRPLFA